MKKITLFLLILLFSLGNLFAIDRNSNDAYQLAQEFFNKPTEKAGLKKAPSTKKSAQLVFSKAKKNKLSTNYYYVFNQNDTDGFVIISGDKSTSEILGYSDEGGFEPQNIPDNLKYWLSVYEDEMDNLTVIDSQKTKVDTSKPSKVTSLSNQTLASVSPLLGDIKWGQGSPYNDQCPIIDSNTKRRAATGCVATGMAQVMKYHQWPITGTGSNSYITGTKQIPLSVDFSKTTFDWANITATYNDNSSVTQKNAVATLMYNCGVAAFMNYAESSGATPRNATRALINNFGYDSNTQYTERAYYTRDEWISMLKEELSAARPVLYDGDTETSGHFFVCDGYDNNNMFHFNWGWNGGLNGYFRISVLDPGDQGIGSSTGGYNKSQGIIIGLQKPTNTTTPISIIRARGTLTYSAPSLARDANIEVKVGSLINKGANDFSGKIGLALYDNNNNYISDLKVNSISGLGSNKGWGNYSFNGFKIGPEVINGYYRIFPVFKTNTGNNWEIIRTYVGTPNYINVNVTSDLIYFSTPTDESPVLQLNSLTKIGNFYSNRNGKINASITNNGKEYNSQIKIKLQSTTDNNIYQIVSSKSINITAGETRELIYNEPITLPAGNYHMSVLYNPNNIPGDDNATQLGNNTAVTILESTYKILIQVGANGTVKESNVTLANNSHLPVEMETTKTFIFTPSTNYGIATLTYNGMDVKSQLVANKYTIPAANANATLSVTFSKQFIHVATAGTLYDLLSADEKNEITNLTVSGTIDARDVKCMRDNMPKLVVLDLSAANIAAYAGNEGTDLNGDRTYLANEMPQRSFQFKTGLTQCKMPNSLTSIGFCAFEFCSGLTGTLAIPSLVNIIGDYAFGGCSSLIGVLTIPRLVTNIGKQGFKDCTGLSQITIARSAPPTIQSTTFDGINKTTCQLEVPPNSRSTYKAANYWKDFFTISESVLIFDISVQVGPNGTVKLNNSLLASNTVLAVEKRTTRTFVFTPAANYGIATIKYNNVDVKSQLAGNQYTTPESNGNATFSVTFGLTKLTINIPQAGTLCNLISFDDKNALTDLTLTGTIDARDVKCMRDNMPKLAVLDLSTTTMAAYAGNEGTDLSGHRTYLANEMPQRSFQFKTGLTQCKMPNSLASIGFCAFEGCSSLTGTLVIPNSVTNINSYAFKACSSLTAVTIPNSVTNIDKQGFKDCTGLSQITVARSLPPIIYDGTTFDGINKSTCQLEVPRGSIPAYKAANQWKDFFSISELTDLATDYFRSVTSGNWDTNTTWESSLDGTNWGTTSLTPSSLAASVSISTGHLINVASDASASRLTVNPGAKLTLNSGKTLTATTLTLQSNASGSATFVNYGTVNSTTTNVEQYLTAGRNWYISSPVSGAKSAVFAATSSNPLYYFVEPNSSNASTRWAQIANSTANLTPTTGYIANMDATVLANKSNVVTFTGALNSGDITTGQNGVPSLTRTVDQERAGYNLVGNPYPSYMNWSDVVRTDVDPTVWYRTKVGEVYKYYTYLPGTGAREEDGISVPAGVTNLIPPMQAFWVRVSAGKTTGSVGFTNAMREHRDQATNIFRAPAATKSARQLVRLQVSNAVNDDEAVLYFNSNASTGFDTYDSPKMSNDNVVIPEIYTTIGAENLVINGMNAIPYDTELALGFKTGQSNSFTLQATEINNLDGVAKLILKDKKLNVEQELALNVPYEFSSDMVNSVNRFSLIFRSPSITTGAQNTEGASSALIYCNENNQIIVNYNNAIASNARVEVYNAVGQKLVSQRMTSAITVINKVLLKGVYMVTVVNDAKSSTQKVIIK